MKSIGFILKLRPGTYDEYKERHDSIWPEMVQALNSFGIGMSIFRHEDTLFVHQWAPSQDSFDKMEAHPVTARWNEYMSEVLATDPLGQRIIFPMEPAFSFGD